MKSWVTDTRFAKPARVARVLIERGDEGLVVYIKLISDLEHFEMEWRFVGVEQLRFRGESIHLLNLVLLQCDDIASQGWEAIRFRVRDYEEEFLSFYCAGIEEVGPPPSAD